MHANCSGTFCPSPSSPPDLQGVFMASWYGPGCYWTYSILAPVAISGSS